MNVAKKKNINKKKQWIFVDLLVYFEVIKITKFFITKNILFQCMLLRDIYISLLNVFFR